MQEKNADAIAKMVEKSEMLISELSDLKNEIDAISNSSLAISENELKLIEGVKEELGLRDRGGLWPINGPGNDQCQWCLGGSGN